MSLDMPNQPGAWPASIARSGLAMDDSGLCLGTFPLLAHDQSEEKSENDADRERLLALLSVAYRRPVGAHVLAHIDAAKSHWRTGGKALANLRLAYAGLPALDDGETTNRVRLADGLLDGGLTPHALMKALDLDTSVLEQRYNPNQPRVPAGSGRESGRWAALWSALTGWLAEPVLEYDHDTGQQVGTRSRGHAIATNPLTIGIAGVSTIAAVEAVAFAGDALLGAEASASEDEVAIAATEFKEQVARGMEAEARVLKDMGFVKNIRAVFTAEGMSIPDVLTDEISLEIKNGARIFWTKQLRIQVHAAAASGREAIVVVGENAYVSKRVFVEFGKVIRRADLGPR